MFPIRGFRPPAFPRMAQTVRWIQQNHSGDRIRVLGGEYLHVQRAK